MKVLLVAPHKKGLGRQEEHPPIGLGYLATALRSAGHQPDIQDCIIKKWNTDKLLDYISSLKPDIVGVTAFSLAMHNVKEIFDAVKKDNPKIITIVGGPHPTAIPERTLQFFTTADYGISGEGEIPLKKLLSFLVSRKPEPSVIPGLIWRQNGQIRWNQKEEYKNIDDFGFPAWDLIDPRRYYISPGVGDKTATIHTSRGCPFGCKFCVRLGRNLRYRDLDHVYQEIRLLSDRYGARRFRISDEGFPINPNFVKAFCRYVIEKQDGFSYIVGPGLRLSVLDDEMLSLMKKAKFAPYVGVGIESGVPRVRKLMEKSLTQEQLYKGVDLLNKYGFRPAGNFILGFPGETKHEMEETIKVALKLNLYGGAFTPFIPLPGSVATQELIQHGELPPDFDFSKIDLDVVLYAPAGMSKKEVDAIRKKAVFLFNMRPRFIIYHLSLKRLYWTLIKFARLFMPTFLVPGKWRIKN